jgi:uncharacterized membrane protein SpoIIM required for sporulation
VNVTNQPIIDIENLCKLCSFRFFSEISNTIVFLSSSIEMNFFVFLDNKLFDSRKDAVRKSETVTLRDTQLILKLTDLF